MIRLVNLAQRLRHVLDRRLTSADLHWRVPPFKEGVVTADKLEDALRTIKALEARLKDLESKMAQKKDAKTVDQVQMKETMKQVARAN